MKRIRRIFIVGVIFSIAALAFSFFTMSDQAEAKSKVVTTKNGTKIYCSDIGNGEYRIYAIKNAKKDLIIPETVDGKHKITEFFSKNFPECKEVERIHFPSGMKCLYEDLDDEEAYRFNTFYQFPNLKKVSVDKKNRYYSAKNGVVYDKKKRLVAIAPGISKVKLASWMIGVIPDAYADLTKLENISVEKGNKKYKSIKGALYSKDGKKLIYYPIAKKDTVFRIPDGVQEIGEMACYNQKYVKEIVMGSSVHQIGEYAFALCDRLKKVSLNKKLKILKLGAFHNKNWLTLSLPEGIEEVEIGSLPVKELEIPSGVKKVKLDVDLHGVQSEIRAETLIVRSLSLDMIKMDEDYSYELEDGDTPEESAYSGKTIYAYKASKAYKQLKKIAKEYDIKLIALEE